MIYGDPISVLVIAYNSGQTIIETLDSIYNQDYKNIELIIVDDFSKDNTVDLVNNWCSTYGNRFINTIVYVQEENVGTSKNAAMGMNLTTCCWTKVIAADDILLTDCISNNLKFAIRNECNSIVCSKMIPFQVINNTQHILLQDNEEIDYLKRLSKKQSIKQYKCLLKRDTLSSPTMFINMKMYKDIGGFDTTIKYIEDWPFKLKLTKLGYKIYFLDIETVKYRIGNSSSHSIDVMYNLRHLEQKKQLKRFLCYPSISKLYVLYYYEELLMCIKDYIIIKIFKNKNKFLPKVVNYGFLLLMPSKWLKVNRRIIGIIQFKLHNTKL